MSNIVPIKVFRCGCVHGAEHIVVSNNTVTCKIHHISWNVKDTTVDSLKYQISEAARIFEYLKKYDADLLEMYPDVDAWLERNPQPIII